MTREELLALGLSEDQAQAVLADAEQTEVEINRLNALLALRDKRDAVLEALPQYKPRDPRLLLKLIDLERITIDEEGLHGLAEQVEALKKTAPYLFADESDPAGGTAASGMHVSEFDMNAFLRGEN